MGVVKKATRFKSVLLSLGFVTIGAALFGGVHMASAQQLALNAPVSSHQTTVEADELQESQLQAGVIDKEAIGPSSIESLPTTVPTVSGNTDGISAEEGVVLAAPILLTAPVSDFTNADIIEAVKRTHSNKVAGLSDSEILEYFAKNIGTNDSSFNMMFGELSENLMTRQLSDTLGVPIELFDTHNVAGLDGTIHFGPGNSQYIQIKAWNPKNVNASQITAWYEKALNSPYYKNTLGLQDGSNIKIVLSDELIPKINAIAAKDDVVRAMFQNKTFLFSTVKQSSVRSSLRATFDAVQAGTWIADGGLLTKISGFFKSKFPGMSSKIAAYSDTFLDGMKVWGTRIGKYARFLEPLALIFGPILAFGGIKKMIAAMKEGGAGHLFTSREGWVGMLQSLSGTLTTAGGAVATAALATSWTGIGGLSLGAIAGILLGAGFALEVAALTVENWDWVKEQAKNVYNKIVDVKNSVVGSVTDFFNEYVKPAVLATGAFVKQVVVKTKVVYDTVKQIITKTIPVVKERIKNVWKSVTTYVTKKVKQVKNVVYTIKEWLTRWVSKTRTFFKNVAYTVKERATRLVTKYKTIVRDVAYRVKESASRWVTKFKNVYRDVAYTAYRTVYKYVNVTRRVTSYVYKSVRKRVSSWVRGIFGWFKKYVYKWVSEKVPVVKYVTDRVRQAVNVAYTAYRRVKDRVAYRAKEYYDVWKTKYKQVKDRVAYTVKENYTKLVTKYKKVKTTVTERVKEEYLNVREGVKQVVSYVTKQVPVTTQVLTQVKETYTDYVQKDVEVEVEVPRTVETEEIKYVRADS